MKNSHITTNNKLTSFNIRELTSDEILLISGGMSNDDGHGKHCACKTCRENNNIAPLNKGIN
jgi:hypothetical protein